jgi:hypothetical protein
MKEFAQFRWFGYVVRMRDERDPKMAWQARTRQTWEEGTQKIVKKRGIE